MEPEISKNSLKCRDFVKRFYQRQEEKASSLLQIRMVFGEQYVTIHKPEAFPPVS